MSDWINKLIETLPVFVDYYTDDIKSSTLATTIHAAEFIFYSLDADLKITEIPGADQTFYYKFNGGIKRKGNIYYACTPKIWVYYWKRLGLMDNWLQNQKV